MAFKKSRRGAKRLTTRRAKENRVARVKDVKRLISANVENKYIQNTQPPGAGSFIDSAGIILQFNAIPQGYDVGQRIGDQIRLRNLDYRFQISNATGTFQRVRLIFFWYRQEPAAPQAVNAAALLSTNSTVPLGDATTIISQYNKRAEGSYTIISDKTYLVTTSNNTNPPFAGVIQGVGGLPIQTGRFVKNLRKKFSQYTGPLTGDPCTKGFLGLLAVSDVPFASATAQKPQLSHSWSLTYEDA